MSIVEDERVFGCVELGLGTKGACRCVRAEQREAGGKAVGSPRCGLLATA